MGPQRRHDEPGAPRGAGFRSASRCTPSWTLPYTSSWGDIWSSSSRSAADMYVANRRRSRERQFRPLRGTTPAPSTASPAASSRKASLKWRYPFVKPGETFTQVLQPIVQLVMSPRLLQFRQDPERGQPRLRMGRHQGVRGRSLRGLDRVDAGSRVNYGFELERLQQPRRRVPRSSWARATSSPAAMTSRRTAESAATSPTSSARRHAAAERAAERDLPLPLQSDDAEMKRQEVGLTRRPAGNSTAR